MLDNRIPINWKLLTLFKSNLHHLQHAGRRTTGTVMDQVAYQIRFIFAYFEDYWDGSFIKSSKPASFTRMASIQ